MAPPPERRRRWVAALAALAFCLTSAPGPALAAPAPPSSDPSRAELSSAEAEPAQAGIELHLYLLGDGGSADPAGDPVLEALARELESDPVPAVVVFLGDNIYPDGLPPADDPERAEMERRLRVQVEAALAGAEEVIVVPGNHDWESGGAGGREAILRQQAFVDRSWDERVRWLPRDGCPGPVVVDRGERLRMVLLDSQWFLQGGHRPEGPGPSCATGDSGAAMGQLREALASAGERHVVLLAHHPLRSAGRHGGYFPLRDHFFPLLHAHPWLWIPLPIVGSAYPIARRMGISTQDQSSAAYRELLAGLEAAFAGHPPLVAAAGHEHNLEILGGDPPPWILISGAGQYGRTTPVSLPEGATWTASEAGFMRLSLQRGGGVELEVLTVDEAAVTRSALRLALARPGRR